MGLKDMLSKAFGLNKIIPVKIENSIPSPKSKNNYADVHMRNMEERRAQRRNK